ncbi:MAG TPA: Tad domain-containing protein [Acidimicrobiales bacterium]
MLVIFALSLVAICAMVALVLDLGQLRAARRINKTATDVAARAGVGRLQYGPWSGVCKARDYLLANATQFTSFDAGTETWSNVAVPPLARATSPCLSVGGVPDAVPCTPNSPATWAKLSATAGHGHFTIEIQTGYRLPDARFTGDTTADTGDASAGSCDNLAVIVTQRQAPLFGGVIGGGDTTLKIRSVGRLHGVQTSDYVAALQLLERHKCGVLQTGGANTRIVAQAFGSYPGVIQIDSADDAGSCPQPMLNAQATSSGPSVVACSTNSQLAACSPGVGANPSRIGMYALNLSRPPGDIASSFPSTYGDTAARATAQTGRGQVDARYRQNLVNLDSNAKSILTGNSGRPPGCTAVVNNGCTGNGLSWLVLEQADCNSLVTFFLVPGRTLAPRIWFHCDLKVTAPLALVAPASTIVVTGQLTVSSAFTIADARTIYVGGKSGANAIGVDVGGATSVLNVNMASAVSCVTRVGAGHATKFVIGNGSLKVASGATAHLCQTFVYMASGYDKIPATDGTTPCSCSYSGTINVTSGGFVDWSAPNEITDRSPTTSELASTNPYEDLALWTEAGGNTNGMTGGSATSLSGVYFLPNADAFNLAGGGSLPIYLSAQFISTTLKVTGGATINLVPNPNDSVPVMTYSNLLVR